MASKGKRRFQRPGAPQGNVMKQLADLQSQMEEAQATLEDEVVTATAGGGAVTVEMTGAQVLKSITIAPEAVDPDDVEMLQDLILAAFKEAQDKVQQLVTERMGPLTGGLDVPGLL
jgi:DNA-binding YbaB/EbfC family protein